VKLSTKILGLLVTVLLEYLDTAAMGPLTRWGPGQNVPVAILPLSVQTLGFSVYYGAY